MEREREDTGGVGWGQVWIWEGCHCGAPAAAGTGVLRALVAADRTGEPVRGPRAVEAGKAEIPERGEVTETLQNMQTYCLPK